MLQPTHVFTKDRATNRALLTHINPTRAFCVGLPVEGHVPGQNLSHTPAWYIWQNGAWYGLGGNEIPEDQVPAELLDNVKAIPFVDTELLSGPSVTRVCKFCKETMNASVYEEHLGKHVEEMLRNTAARRDKPAPRFDASAIKEAALPRA